ncbi:MAG: 3-methyl-2-oxobutanoate hydroxymethyltransferase [Gemmataceae bacterium]|nr:3-methyl-2-oxobutanoate hydroxymethyltransferase [Gemmataceae bacterium]
MSAVVADRPVTVPDFATAKAQGRKLAVITAYDFALARIYDQAGVDALLIGDSLGMVVQGNENCLSVTLEDAIYHTRCVARAARRSLLIGDMPFMTYLVSPEDAVRNAGRLVQQGGAHAVKLEGGERTASAIRAIVDAEIPVLAHVGLTPQSVRRIGGFRVQRDADKILADALAVQKAGAFAVVVECVPADLAARLTKELTIPTIGIGAGAGCDGQVLVGHDLLGLFDGVRPRFVKRYAELGKMVAEAVENYCGDVREGKFPGPEHEFK